jgi:hypothetical protein
MGAILNRKGKFVKFDNLTEAITECKNAIQFLRHKKGIKYPESLKDWEHDLFELQKIKTQQEQWKTN